MISVRQRKKKGREFEKETANDVAEAFGLDEDDVLRAHPSDQGKDLHLSGRAKRFFPYWTECKNHKTLQIPAWIRQAEKGAREKGEGLTPIVVFKQHRNRQKYVLMRLEHLLELRRMIGEQPWVPQKKNSKTTTRKKRTENLSSKTKSTSKPTRRFRIRIPTSKKVDSSGKTANRGKGRC